MTKQEKEMLEKIAKEFTGSPFFTTDLTYDLDNFECFEVRAMNLDLLSSRLPEGKMKEFFEEINNLIAQEEELDKMDKEMEKLMQNLKDVKSRFDTGQFPKGIPEIIIKTYQWVLGFMIVVMEEQLHVFSSKV